jgi:hypothetical protein
MMFADFLNGLMCAKGAQKAPETLSYYSRKPSRMLLFGNYAGLPDKQKTCARLRTQVYKLPQIALSE